MASYSSGIAHRYGSCQTVCCLHFLDHAGVRVRVVFDLERLQCLRCRADGDELRLAYNISDKMVDKLTTEWEDEVALATTGDLYLVCIGQIVIESRDVEWRYSDSLGRRSLSFPSDTGFCNKCLGAFVLAWFSTFGCGVVAKVAEL